MRRAHDQRLALAVHMLAERMRQRRLAGAGIGFRQADLAFEILPVAVLLDQRDQRDHETGTEKIRAASRVIASNASSSGASVRPIPARVGARIPSFCRKAFWRADISSPRDVVAPSLRADLLNVPSRTFAFTISNACKRQGVPRSFSGRNRAGQPISSATKRGSPLRRIKSSSDLRPASLASATRAFRSASDATFC